MSENDIKEEVLEEETRNDNYNLPIEELNQLIEKKYIEKFARKPEILGIHLPISIVRNLDLSDDTFYNFLNVVAESNYDRLVNAIVIDHDLTPDEVMEFFKRFPSHITRTPIGFINRYYSDFIDFIIKNQDLFTIDILPQAIRDDKRIITTFVKTEPIEEKEQETVKKDYADYAQEYLDSKMSLTNFCLKNGISNIYRFRKYIQQLKTEKFGKKDDRESAFIHKGNIDRNNHKKRAALIGKAKVKDIAIKIARGEITLEDYFRDYFHPDITVWALASTLEGKELNDFNNNMASQLMKYIIEDHPKDLDADKIGDLFDYEHSYIINQESLENNKLGNDVETFIKNYSPRYDHMVTERLIKNVNAGLKPWTDLYGSKTIQYMLDSKRDILSPVFEITDDLINDVVNYLVEHDIYVCYKSVSLYLRKALLGEITLKEETVETSEEPEEVNKNKKGM